MEKNVPDSPLGAMYREHIALIMKKDIDGLLAQYAPDALLISSFGGDRQARYYRGHQELREHFQGILALQDLEVEIAFWARLRMP